jgi:hypothetical protein
LENPAAIGNVTSVHAGTIADSDETGRSFCFKSATLPERSDAGF